MNKRIFVKSIFTIVLIFVFAHLGGKYYWPFLSYVTNLNLDQVGRLVISIFVIAGVVSLVFSYFIGKNKSLSLYLFVTAFALFTTYNTCIKDRFFSLSHYEDGYMAFRKGLCLNERGLVNKFGKEVLAPKYTEILKVFSRRFKQDVFVGIQYDTFDRGEADSIIMERGGNLKEVSHSRQVKSFRLNIFSLEGKRLDSKTVDSMCYESMKEYVSQNVGDIIENYCFWWAFRPGEFYCIKDEQQSARKEKLDSSPEEELHSQDEVIQECNKQVHEEAENDNKGSQRQQVWKERWIPCISCDPNRKGFCNNCHGEGGYYIGNIFNVCGVCNGTRVCSMCGGRGETKEMYSTWE